ncbi:MAG: TRAP transporter large permease [Peptostreptococcaceae bacterium]|nr:TRAP transporter large permease [Peptostreptococcaceae bacterium]
MYITLIMVLFFILLLIALPIGMILGILSIIPNIIDPWFPADIQYIIRSMINGVNNFPILAVPMFILSGNIMSQGKISEKLFDFFAYFVADKKAGLPIAVITTCLFYGAISGSGPATTAAVGAMTIPILTKVGYKKDFSTALVAVSGGLGVIIPPSIPFIFFGQSAGISVSKLFIAGIIPGILIAIALMCYSYYYCKKNGEDVEKLKLYSKTLKSKGIKNLFFDSFFALLCPIIVLGSIYSKIASPTESAVMSVFYALFISICVYKTINLRDIKKILIESVKTYSTILFIIAAATAFSRVLIFMHVSDIISTNISNIVSNKITLLIIVNIILLIIGMIMDTTPAILILTPMLLPLMKQYGVDPIHFGVFMVVNLAIGFVTPPLGVNLFVASTITNIKMEDIIKKVIPFVIVFIVVLLIITFVPQFSLLLVK